MNDKMPMKILKHNIVNIDLIIQFIEACTLTDSKIKLKLHDFLDTFSMYTADMYRHAKHVKATAKSLLKPATTFFVKLLKNANQCNSDFIENTF